MAALLVLKASHQSKMTASIHVLLELVCEFKFRQYSIYMLFMPYQSQEVGLLDVTKCRTEPNLAHFNHQRTL